MDAAQIKARLRGQGSCGHLFEDDNGTAVVCLLPDDGHPHSRAAERFRRDASAWKQETAHMSTVIDMVLHPAYQRIIGLGPDAVPLIMQDLRDNGPAHWFWALSAIVGDDKAMGAHSIPKATQMWLDWWKDTVNW